ncbi:MAG: adenosine deaminase, partial [Elusimicrobia bacterium]|nr:adenosine deaminase [Elusimicrobiota bacterium]
LAEALPLGRIDGIGLDSSEKNRPPSLFQRVFSAARAAGLRAVAHAGEEGPASYIEEALDLLQVERIDHGVRCAEDPALMKILARHGVPLTVCPLSNERLRVFPSLQDHNLRTLLAAGLNVSIHSDDPAYFGGYIDANYRETARALKLTKPEVAALARNSFLASWLTDREKGVHLADIDRLAAG